MRGVSFGCSAQNSIACSPLPGWKLAESLRERKSGETEIETERDRDRQTDREAEREKIILYYTRIKI